MKRRAFPMTLAVAALLLGGCTMDSSEPTSTAGPSGVNGNGRVDTTSTDPGTPPQDVQTPDWTDNNDSLSLNILDARLDGSVGPVGQLASQATETTSYADGYWSTVTVTVDKEGSGAGAAMAILDMQGDIRALEAGVYQVDFVAPDSDEFTQTQPQDWETMYIIGCSGDDPGEWSFDQPADDAEIVVDDSAADVLTITFTANFSSGSVYDWETGDAHDVGSSSVTGTLHIAR